VISARTTILVLVGSGCIAAAGIGAYLGVRSASETSLAGAPSNPAALAAANSTPAPVAPDAPVRTEHSAPVVAERSAVPATPSGTPVTTSAAPISTQATPGDQPDVVAPVPVPSDDLTISPATTSEIVAPGPEAAARVELDELTVPADAVIGIRFDSNVSSETARIEDRVSARVVRDVTIGGRVAVRSGSRLEGTVTLVERGNRFRDRARIGVRFSTLLLSDNTRLPIQTETIFRDGEAPGGEATAKIGGATIIGTILGSVLGGRKGAAIGTVAGAAGGSAAVANSDRNPATMPKDSLVTVRMTAPLTLTVPREAH
jgi:hypothetical protein